MPESKRRKNRRQSRFRSPKTQPASSQPPESSEMNGNERILEISELTFRQQSVLPVLAVSRSIAQAARDAGVAESTLRRWLSEPSFREQLDDLRKESHDLARHQAQAVLPACLAVVAETALESQDPALRFRAARFLITYASDIGEVDDLRAEVEDLRQSVDLTAWITPSA